jgi:hypothetical protein
MKFAEPRFVVVIAADEMHPPLEPKRTRAVQRQVRRAESEIPYLDDGAHVRGKLLDHPAQAVEGAVHVTDERDHTGRPMSAVKLE